MLKDLIKIANKLDEAGLNEEASELDLVIKSLAQDLSFMNESMFENDLKVIEDALCRQAKEKVAEIREAINSMDKTKGTKSSKLWHYIGQNPVVIKYPS